MPWNPKKLTKSQLEERRFVACDYFEKGNVNCARIAEEIGASRASTSTWYKTFLKHGRIGLEQKEHEGPGKLITAEQIIEIKEVIKKGAKVYGFEGDYWSSKRVVEVIFNLTGVSYHFNHVSKLMHEWGFSYQQPEKRHIKRNEKTIADWLAQTLPELKKTKF
jgi:transposase